MKMAGTGTGRLLSLHSSPASLSSPFTTAIHSHLNGPFFSPVRLSIPSFQLKTRHRMLVPVPRAGGPPSTTTLLFALLLPLSLLLGTIFATRRVEEQLDQKYMEELVQNIVIMEENEMLDDEIYEDEEDENADESEDDELVPATQPQSRLNAN